ncbi:helix-turn-helix domain-containing protein [Simiduia agarivorans]|uniref:Transcriptional regulator n=1 Tax=Simiduia agarivorans (strain DSM 21679 / JCM 13881 / BCRC 17597 / SA1) TaxID=1117647 RepID=K4KN26_SIMAS|nr:helix-turn-helix domain-containing protein [Simiduia agarivorans]AFV00432.1 putative transcriptional regulator [Simiduia agarivorans SA1 = DSM 21679]
MIDTLFTPLYLWATLQALALGVMVPFLRLDKSNVFLGSFFVLTALNVLFQYLLVFTDFRLQYPETVFVSDAIGFCYGPVLYLYYRQLIFERMELRQWLHFMPVGLYLLYFIGFELLWRDFRYENYIDQPQHIAVLSLIALSNLIYLFALLHSIKRNDRHKGVKEFKLISWLDMLIGVFLLKSLLHLYIFTMHTFFESEVLAVVRLVKDVLFISTTVLIVVAAQWFLLRYPELILHGSSLDTADEDDAGDPLPDVGKSEPDQSLTLEEAERLKALVSGQKLYLDAELTEAVLARHFGVPSYYLSRLLNQVIGKRFNEFINSYRVEEAKRLLASPDSSNRTMFAVSLDSGFKSESVFYTNFKKYTQMTPRAYKLKFAR